VGRARHLAGLVRGLVQRARDLTGRLRGLVQRARGLTGRLRGLVQRARDLTGLVRGMAQLVTVLAAGWAMASCTAASGSGGVWPEQSTGSGTTPVRPTLSTPTTLVVPPGAQEPTREGAVAFFRYFWAVHNQAYRGLDTRLLRDLSEPTCRSCQRIADQIDTAARNGERFEGGLVTVSVAAAAPGQSTTGLLVNGVVEQTPSRTVNSEGRVVGTGPANIHRRVDAAVRWNGSRWSMMGLDVLGTDQ
jgi:hypothetical protein